jgi:hypothetical protein
VKKTFRQKWANWTTPTKVTVVGAVLGLVFAAIQVLPIVISGIGFLNEKVHGPPPITASTEVQLEKALVELDDNIDCLQSLRAFYDRELGWSKCQLRSTYLRSLSRQFSSLTARDHFRESERIYDAFLKLLEAYDEINAIDDRSDFIKFERNSSLQLRDVHFISIFLRYYYERFNIGDSGCYDNRGRISNRCQKIFDNNDQTTTRFDDLTLQWESMPAKYIKIGDQIAKTVGDWHSCIDGVSTMEVYEVGKATQTSKNGEPTQEVKVLGIDGYYFDYNVPREGVVHVIISGNDKIPLDVPRMC